jgi:hypothetical protein
MSNLIFLNTNNIYATKRNFGQKMSSHKSSSDSSGAGKPTDLSNLPLPGGVYTVWSPEEQKKYENKPAVSDGGNAEEELVVKSGPPAKLERCDNGAPVTKSEVLKTIDDYVKGVLASDMTENPGMLEEELTYVNADIERVHSESNGSRVLEDIYQKYC